MCFFLDGGIIKNDDSTHSASLVAGHCDKKKCKIEQWNLQLKQKQS